ALVDHLEEEGRVLLAERQVADLVQDEEFGPDQVAHEVLEAVSRPLLAGLEGEVVEREEVDAVAGLDGLERESRGQVRLADAAGTQEEDVLALVEEAERHELLQGLPGHVGGGGEVEGVERRSGRQPCEAEVRLDAPLEARTALDLEEFIEHFDYELLLLLSTLEHRIEGGEGGTHGEVLEVLPDACVAQGGAHQATSPRRAWRAAAGAAAGAAAAAAAAAAAVEAWAAAEAWRSSPASSLAVRGPAARSSASKSARERTSTSGAARRSRSSAAVAAPSCVACSVCSKRGCLPRLAACAWAAALPRVSLRIASACSGSVTRPVPLGRRTWCATTSPAR